MGMVIGVYGIGYLAASAAPTRHWPIVLVGFLGKILGPMGFVFGVAAGTVPIERLHTHHFPLEAAADAVRTLTAAGDRPAISITIEP